MDLIPLPVGIAASLFVLSLLINNPHAVPPVVENAFDHVWDGSIGGVLVALNTFTLATLIVKTRLRGLISLWLAVAVFAGTLGVVLRMAATARYDAGWYMASILNLASSAALMVALLIEHFHMHAAAELRAAFHEQEAIHDPLTGTFNRRYLMSQLKEELGRAQRYRYPVSVLMLDVDRFKRVNDEHGHAAGDACLRALAVALGERVHRHGDFSARYGGEEFVVVLPETGVDGAAEVAEEIRRRIEDIHGRGLAPCAMTVSIGIATAMSSAPTTPEEMLNQADECLYRAKREGRNRVEWPGKSGGLHLPDLRAVLA